MRSPTSLERVIEILEQKGFTADQVAHMCNNLTKNSFEMLYAAAIKLYTTEDFAEIEACTTDVAKNKKVLEIYAMRTGNNPYDDLDMLIEKFANEFIALHGSR